MTYDNTCERRELEGEDGLYNVSECYRLMLEAGADFGAKTKGLPWEILGWSGGNGFQDVIAGECCVSSTSFLTMFRVLKLTLFRLH